MLCSLLSARKVFASYIIAADHDFLFGTGCSLLSSLPLIADIKPNKNVSLAFPVSVTFASSIVELI